MWVDMDAANKPISIPIINDAIAEPSESFTVTLSNATGATNTSAHIALGRPGAPEDCAKVVEFLATDLSDYVTGQLIQVDGGMW